MLLYAGNYLNDERRILYSHDVGTSYRNPLYTNRYYMNEWDDIHMQRPRVARELLPVRHPQDAYQNNTHPGNNSKDNTNQNNKGREWEGNGNWLVKFTGKALMGMERNLDEKAIPVHLWVKISDLPRRNEYYQTKFHPNNEHREQSTI
ncbi:hypothetical protein HELRODRAFT_165297 [Helobdella robusta]|uniref:Uncharacterized protein n=1 Tax=Helobdella robusta TaxID=6412 RepID=T1EWJ9_HELRO|nr:hypothetical protein HELRODRAFT_165297 [Helobdella robusta]ESN91292.1 hypothetical protein HELRODRAFT_165297 [Helobdella robusta]